MKFLHASDIHLDSPLVGLERYQSAPVERIRGATRITFERLVNLAIEEAVDFVLIAGDLYDDDWKDFNTGLYFVRKMYLLRDSGIKVYIVHGNHDAANNMTSTLRLPDNVFAFSHKKPELARDDNLGIAIHGQGYSKRAVTDNLARAYADPEHGYLNIGLLHTNVGGSAGHENYAPCSLADLINKGYDYWALGHIHQREILNQSPWIAYSGNCQGRHIREEGPKGCLLVEVRDNNELQVAFRELDTVRWKRCSVPINNAKTPDDVVELISNHIGGCLTELDGQLLAARVIVQGESEAHGALVEDPEHWRNEIRAGLFGFNDEVWLESVRFESRTNIDLTAIETREDALGELLRLIRDVKPDTAALEKFQDESLQSLISKLPPEMRHLGLELQEPSALARILEDVKLLIYQSLLRQESDR